MGILLQLTDKRKVFFRERQIGETFQGDGHKLGGSKNSQDGRSRLVPVSARSRNRSGNNDNMEETSELPGKMDSNRYNQIAVY